jgi:hypothetical protein
LINQLQNKKAILASFKNLRSDEVFNKFWQKVQDFSNKNNILLTILPINED